MTVNHILSATFGTLLALLLVQLSVNVWKRLPDYVCQQTHTISYR